MTQTLTRNPDCKTTAALIGQQSFGGSRASGTNDKAGSSNPVLRFTSPRLIKEEFFPVSEYLYPSNKPAENIEDVKGAQH